MTVAPRLEMCCMKFASVLLRMLRCVFYEHSLVLSMTADHYHHRIILFACSFLQSTLYFKARTINRKSNPTRLEGNVRGALSEGRSGNCLTNFSIHLAIGTYRL